MPTQTAVGTAYFRINGVQYQLAGDLRITWLRTKREALVGMDGHVAPQHNFQSPMIECTVRDRADVDPVPLESMEAETITAELTNGTTWELSQAFYTGDGELDASEGGIQVRFNGQSMRRIR